MAQVPYPDHRHCKSGNHPAKEPRDYLQRDLYYRSRAQDMVMGERADLVAPESFFDCDHLNMDFSLSPEQLDLQVRTHRFVADIVMPYERDARQTPHGPSEALRDELVAEARSAGLLTPHASRELGGLGLSHVDKAIVFEEAGYSPPGPVALNIHAPDEGNVHLVEIVATPEQRRRWLHPLVDGRTRSCFCMTEPAPGAGSDPSMMQARAVTSDAGQRLMARVPQRRFGTPADLDGPLLLLASDAGRYMTGSVLAVDGGHLVSSL